MLTQFPRSLPFILLSLLVTHATFAKDTSSNTTEMKEWSFLIYLNGNNNLDSFGTTNITQMEKVGSSDQINVVVQWASLASKKVKRLYITKGNNPKAVTSPVIQDMGSVDMGSWKSLSDFIQWGVSKYPAKHYFVSVWDHGSGWHALRTQMRKPIVKTNIFFPTDISWDDNTGSSISTLQLSQALAEGAKAIGHKIDLFATDACLMAMAEVATEVSDSVEFYAGSEEVEPAAGWPYEMILSRWTSNPKIGADEVGKIVTDEYVKSYSGGSNGSANATYSVFNLNKLNTFLQSFSTFASLLGKVDSSEKETILKAAQNTQNFTYADYSDLSDFLSNLIALPLNPSFKTEVSTLTNHLQELMVANSTTSNFSKAKGLSIWLPVDLTSYKDHSDQYQTLKFNSSTHWGEALLGLYQ